MRDNSGDGYGWPVVVEKIIGSWPLLIRSVVLVLACTPALVALAVVVIQTR